MGRVSREDDSDRVASAFMVPADEKPASGLIRHGCKLFNAETPSDVLGTSFVTAQRDLYVRNHGDVPAIDAATFSFEVDGLVARPLRLSMTELTTRFAVHEVEAVMQCAGKRRAEMQAYKQTEGDPWSTGVIGNCRWTGVRLGDVLAAAGAETREGLHVAFEAADEGDIEGEWACYGVSIPMAKAIAPDVLLAFGVNGGPLMAEHGFPLRVMVPGYAGARSVKWVRRITVQATESTNAVQRKEYRLQGPDVTRATSRHKPDSVINEMPLDAAILYPENGMRLNAGPVVLRGYAIDTQAGIETVEVSADGGESWIEAKLERGGRWSWVLWTARLELAAGDHELMVRAVASDGRTQPAAMADIWNFRGYLANCWHRVTVKAA